MVVRTLSFFKTRLAKVEIFCYNEVNKRIISIGKRKGFIKFYTIRYFSIFNDIAKKLSKCVIDSNLFKVKKKS